MAVLADPVEPLTDPVEVLTLPIEVLTDPVDSLTDSVQVLSDPMEVLQQTFMRETYSDGDFIVNQDEGGVDAGQFSVG